MQSQNEEPLKTNRNEDILMLFTSRVVFLGNSSIFAAQLLFTNGPEVNNIKWQ